MMKVVLNMLRSSAPGLHSEVSSKLVARNKRVNTPLLAYIAASVSEEHHEYPSHAATEFEGLWL